MSASPAGLSELLRLYVQSRNGLTDTSTCPMYVCITVSPRPYLFACIWVQRGVGASGLTHVYLAIFESLLQIVVYGLIGDLADQGKIRYTDFLLLGGLEDGFLCELRRGLPFGRRFLLAPCALRHRLSTRQSSTRCRCAAASLGFYHDRCPSASSPQ